MRLVLALVVAVIVAACAVGQSGAEWGFGRGDSARAAQAAYDAEIILQGIAQARDFGQRVARDMNQTSPAAAPPPITR